MTEIGADWFRDSLNNSESVARVTASYSTRSQQKAH